MARPRDRYVLMILGSEAPHDVGRRLHGADDESAAFAHGETWSIGLIVERGRR